MEFPDTPRVIYGRNPLAEVACQIRFPRILAIDERIPAGFQNALGPDYPFVETREVVQFQFGPDAESSPARRTHYDFLTEDRRYIITLSSDFISITTQDYERWEIFSKHIKSALDCLTNIYPVTLFTRVGLRYIDVVSKKLLDLEKELWSDLIIPSALGLLHEEAVPVADVLELNAATSMKLENGSKVVLRTGLGKIEKTGDEIVFIVDGDFFKDELVKSANDAIDACSIFNREAGRAFRWIISKKLHDALEPRSPDLV